MNKAKRIVDNMDSENAFAVCSEIELLMKMQHRLSRQDILMSF